MSASIEEFQQLRAYMGSSRELTQWITGAKALALLGGAFEAGVMDALRTKCTGKEIADAMGTDKQGVVDLCRALEAHGVVQRDGESYQLAPDFSLLSSPTAAIPLADVVR